MRESLFARAGRPLDEHRDVGIGDAMGNTHVAQHLRILTGQLFQAQRTDLRISTRGQHDEFAGTFGGGDAHSDPPRTLPCPAPVVVRRHVTLWRS